jgi:hypothetical protein
LIVETVSRCLLSLTQAFGGDTPAMNYTSGDKVEIGDHVMIGALEATVTGVIERGEPDWEDHGGVSLQGPSFGAMILPWIREDLVLIRRAASRDEARSA